MASSPCTCNNLAPVSSEQTNCPRYLSPTSSSHWNKHGYCIFQPNRTKIGRRLRLVDTEQPPMNPVIYASHHGYMEDAVARNTIPARTYRKSRALSANAHGRSFPLRTNAPWRHTSFRTSCGRVNVSLGTTTPQFFSNYCLYLSVINTIPSSKLVNFAPKPRMRNQMSCFCQI